MISSCISYFINIILDNLDNSYLLLDNLLINKYLVVPNLIFIKTVSNTNISTSRYSIEANYTSSILFCPSEGCLAEIRLPLILSTNVFMFSYSRGA